jgi:hypothetical protein
MELRDLALAAELTLAVVVVVLLTQLLVLALVVQEL